VPTPFLGEIKMFAGAFAPVGWRFCDGALLAISENDALFNLIGTTYGGDGQSTFAVPDFRGRIPLHQGTGFVMGQASGVEEVTLTVQQIPSHSHLMIASNAASNTPNPANATTAVNNVVQFFSGDAPSSNMAATAISATGGNQPHTNFQPYLCVSFIIALEGVYPTPN